MREKSKKKKNFFKVHWGQLNASTTISSLTPLQVQVERVYGISGEKSH